MDIQDVIATLIIVIPFVKMIVIDQDLLSERKTFLIYLIVGIVSWIIGAAYIHFFPSENNGFVYFCSQMTLHFLLLYNIIVYPYRKIFKRNPEVSQSPTRIIDMAPSFVILMGTILSPMFLDVFLIKYLIN